MKYLIPISILFLCLIPHKVHAQTFIQSKTVECSGGSLASCVLTFTSPIGSGHALIGACGPYAGTGVDASSIVDSAGSTYTPVTRHNGGSGAMAVAIQPFYTLNSGSGGGSTITCNYSPNWTGGVLFVTASEYSSPPTALDVTAVGDSTTPGGVNPITAIVTPNFQNSLNIGIYIQYPGNTNCAGGDDNQGQTYTLRSKTNWVAIEDETVSQPYPYSAAFATCDATGGTWSAYYLAFKSAVQSSPQCPGTSSTYFVQCATAQTGSAKTLSATFTNHSGNSHTIFAVVQVIQSNGNNGDAETVTDSDSNTYVSRTCQDGGAGNATNCVYESHATTNNTLTITVNVVMGVNPPSNKNIHLAILEYKNLAAFSAVSANASSGGPSIDAGGLGFNTSANTFYFVAAGQQGDRAIVTFTGPAGYTDRATRNNNNTGAGSWGAIDTFDNFIAGAQTDYTITVSNNGGLATANLSIILLTYGVTSGIVPHRAVIY